MDCPKPAAVAASVPQVQISDGAVILPDGTVLSMGTRMLGDGAVVAPISAPSTDEQPPPTSPMSIAGGAGCVPATRAGAGGAAGCQRAAGWFVR